jgi:hypothetical protein
MPAMAFTFYGNVCEHKQLLTHNMAIVALLWNLLHNFIIM